MWALCATQKCSGRLKALVDTVWFNFLAHSPSTIIWKPSEITSKEVLGNGLPFPSFLPTENCNLLFDFFYKTGLQRNSKGKKACLKTRQPAMQLELPIHAGGISQLAAATSPCGWPRLPSALAITSILWLDNSNRCSNTSTRTGQPGMCMFSAARV